MRYDIVTILFCTLGLIYLRSFLSNYFSNAVASLLKRIQFNGTYTSFGSESQSPSEAVGGGYEIITKALSLISQEYSNPHFTIDRMADMLSTSKRNLQRKFKQHLNQTPSAMLREYRMNKATELLNKGLKINTVGYSVGFVSHSYFCKCFKQRFSCTPSEFIVNRRKAA